MILFLLENVEFLQITCEKLHLLQILVLHDF